MTIIDIMTRKQIEKLINKRVKIETEYLVSELTKERIARIDLERSIQNLFSVKRRYVK